MSYNYRLIATFAPSVPEDFPPPLQLEKNNNEVSIFYMQNMGIMYLEAESDPVGGVKPVLLPFVFHLGS